ncbi:MAG: hypothetical protein ACYSWQ_01185 [Planctomycetota bacterium]
MKTQRIVATVSAMLICASPASVFAGEASSAFIASRVYQSADTVYALAGGEFDLDHAGMEIACLTSDGLMSKMLQLSPNFLTWEVAVRHEGPTPVLDMKTRPTIGVGDVHSGYPGNEVVMFTRHPSVITAVLQDPNGAWSHEILVNNIGWIGDGWGARVGDYDPYRPGDEIFFIYESPMDFSSGMLFRETAGVWEQEYIYGADEPGEVGMDSVAGDFNWDHTGPEMLIVTEMGPTYELMADQDPNQDDWPRRTVWDEHDDAGWVVKVADVDPWSPGNEIVYGTRYSNRIVMSRHNGAEPHDLQILFTGNAMAQEVAEEMWDIAVGDVLLRSPGLEILGVDETGSVYLVQRIGDAWEGQVIWQDSEPLYAVTVGDFLPQRSGDEILVAGKSGAITMLIPTHRGYFPGNERQ